MSSKKKSSTKRASTRAAKLDKLSEGLKIPLSTDAKDKLSSMKGASMSRTAVNAAHVAHALGHQRVTENDAIAAMAIHSANKKKSYRKKK